MLLKTDVCRSTPSSHSVTATVRIVQPPKQPPTVTDATLSQKKPNLRLNQRAYRPGTSTQNILTASPPRLLLMLTVTTSHTRCCKLSNFLCAAHMMKLPALRSSTNIAFLGVPETADGKSHDHSKLLRFILP